MYNIHYFRSSFQQLLNITQNFDISQAAIKPFILHYFEYILI
jgi:hypothetical protein